MRSRVFMDGVRVVHTDRSLPESKRTMFLVARALKFSLRKGCDAHGQLEAPHKSSSHPQLLAALPLDSPGLVHIDGLGFVRYPRLLP